MDITPEDAKLFRDKYVLSNHSNFGQTNEDKATAVIGLGISPENYDKIIGKPKEEYKSKQLNWSNYPKDWEHCKALSIKKMKEGDDLFLVCHSRDTIVGKPQLITEVKQTIPLIIKVEKKDKEGNLSVAYKFIDERYDKRYDGIEKDSFEKSFFVYRVISEDQEYMVFSDQKLDPEMYSFSGMSIKMPVGTELTKTLRIRSIAKIFISKEAISSVKVMESTDLVEFTKRLKEEIGLDQEGFINLTFLHPDGNVYLHSPIYNLIRISQLLSGKYEGYPLSVGNMGNLALGKTKELEALDMKFEEPKGICEAGNSTPKVLVPSFKEKPANPGYILSCNRLALVDELMKMVDNANNGTRQGEAVRNSLGQLNMILEHKKRTIGSGNDNSLMAKATAKCIFAMNPLSGKSYLRDHLSILDATTMSRILWLVQDENEQNFIRNNVPFKCGNTYAKLYTQEKRGYMIKIGVTTYYIYDIYKIIYDSCQSFLSNYDSEKVKNLFKTTCEVVQEPMKSIWKGRGLHHTILLLDGLVKFRCLFKDYDPSFTATEEDYNMLEVLLITIIQSWDTNLNKNQDNGRANKDYSKSATLQGGSHSEVS